MTGRLRDLGVALLVAALAAWAGAALYQTTRDAALPNGLPVGDRVQQAADALGSGDGVYVASDAHDLVPPADERRLEQLVADSPVTVHVVVWEHSSDAGYGGDFDALYQLERLLGEAVYIVYGGPGQGVVDDNITDVRLDPSPESDFFGDPVRRLTELVESVAAAEVEPVDGSDYWGGPGGVIAAGLLFALLALPTALLVIGLGRLALGRSYRMRGGWW